MNLDGKESYSSYAVIERSSLTTEEYRKQLKDLYNYYYHVEIDPKIPIEEKIPKMVEWWEKAHELFIKEKISIHSIEDMAREAHLGFRPKVKEFLDELEKSDVPLLIFSAGIADTIDVIIKVKYGRVHSNVHVIGNRIISDENGLIVGFHEPLIHVYNKNEISVSHDHSATWFGSVEKRKNVILLGDSLGDLGMAEGIKNPEVVLKIGFLNKNIEENLESYSKSFDVLILNDGTFEFPLQLIREIIGFDDEKKH
eukprot:TRINITY_DN2026_c0_g1_i3.p1 TRINITY_DN2026_c0_g1~~TRINITY_DN2026_c0_g1_i3.p1  ORF type:complete len:254 (-),score=69.43 TRINITY_DN2026_c0_g1_i3:109-870(-)